MSERYALEDLLRVRRFREDAAAAEVSACMARLEEAEQALERRKVELAEYREWRVDKEASLYDEITGKMVKVNDLDELKQAIALLREREVEYGQRILDAEADLDRRRGELEGAQQAHRDAARNTAKIEEHRRQWAEERRKEDELAEDRELEDFKAPDRGADADDDDMFGEDTSEAYHVQS